MKKVMTHAKHGMHSSRLYSIWECMRARCEREKHVAYHRYGGRGITVCEEWREFVPFAAWALQNGYSADLEIDRRGNDGNYEPDNCRFVTHAENMENTHRAVRLTIGGETLTLSQAARRFGVERHTIRTRLRRGWPIERALIPSMIPRKKDRVQCA